MPLLLKNPSRVFRAVPRVLRNRAGSILLAASIGYALLFFAFLLQQGYYRLPASFFLNFERITVNGGNPAEPHKPIPIEVCRTKRADINIQAYRRFYSGPADPTLTTAAKKERGRVVRAVELKGPLEDAYCAQLTIPLTQYDHAPGEYYFTQDVFFDIHGQQKHTEYQSPIYVVADFSDPADIKKEILRLQQRILELEDKLKTANIPFTPTPISKVPATIAQPANTSTVSEPTTSAPPENPQPSSPTLFDRATNLVNNVL